MSDATKAEKKSATPQAAGIAAVLAAVVAGPAGYAMGADAVQAIWDADKAAQIAAGKPDPQPIVDAQPDEYMTAMVDLKDGSGEHRIRTKGKREWAEAGKRLGIVTTVCGNDQETPTACPKVEAKDLCAICPPTWILQPYPSLDGKAKPCNAGSYEVPGEGCEILAGPMCRHGYDDTGEPCDPRAPPCEPWPCVLSAGDNPELQVLLERRAAKLKEPAWAEKHLAVDGGQ